MPHLRGMSSMHFLISFFMSASDIATPFCRRDGCSCCCCFTYLSIYHISIIHSKDGAVLIGHAVAIVGHPLPRIGKSMVGTHHPANPFSSYQQFMGSVEVGWLPVVAEVCQRQAWVLYARPGLLEVASLWWGAGHVPAMCTRHAQGKAHPAHLCAFIAHFEFETLRFLQ